MLCANQRRRPRDQVNAWCRRLSIGIGFATLLLSARSSVADTLGEPMDEEEEELAPSRSLRARFSYARVAEGLVGSGAQRLSALRRLSSTHSSHPLRLLSHWLESAPPPEPEETLDWVRALAPHAHLEAVRKWLFRIAVSHPPDSVRSALREEQDTAWENGARAAALALAAAHDKDALALLGKALRRDTQASGFARDALVAFPPHDLTALLGGSGTPSVEAIHALQAIADQRAFDPLRAAVRRGTPEVQAAASLALLRLGDLETVALAHYWHKHGVVHRELVAASAEILLEADPEHAADAFSRYLERDPEAALQLAQRMPSVSSAEPIIEAFSSLPERLIPLALRALGTCPGARPVRFLESQLLEARFSRQAALALAQSSALEADTALFTASTNPKSSALAIEALVQRYAARGAPPAGLLQTLERWSVSATPQVRELGIWGRAVFDAHYAIAQVQILSGADLQALARAAAFQGTEFFKLAGKRWANAKAPQSNTLLLLALLRTEASEAISSAQLLRLAYSHQALALLATWRLAERAGTDQAEVLQTYLHAKATRPAGHSPESVPQEPDPALRAVVYLGLGARPIRELGADPTQTASALLVRAYFGENQSEVRTAIIVALSQRPRTPAIEALLSEAQRLDPNHEVRQHATLAARGGRLANPASALSLMDPLLSEPHCPAEAAPPKGHARGHAWLPMTAPPGEPSSPFLVRLALSSPLMNSADCRASVARDGPPDRPPNTAESSISAQTPGNPVRAP